MACRHAGTGGLVHRPSSSLLRDGGSRHGASRHRGPRRLTRERCRRPLSCRRSRAAQAHAAPAARMAPAGAGTDPQPLGDGSELLGQADRAQRSGGAPSTPPGPRRRRQPGRRRRPGRAAASGIGVRDARTRFSRAAGGRELLHGRRQHARRGTGRAAGGPGMRRSARRKATGCSNSPSAPPRPGACLFGPSMAEACRSTHTFPGASTTT